MAESKDRQYARLYVSSFAPEVIEGYVKARGKAAPLFDDLCKNPSCKAVFTVRAYTAVTQFKKYKRFLPPTHCKKCFDMSRGLAVPIPPGNASIKHKEPSPYTPPIPAELTPRELAIYNRKWQGKEVMLWFKEHVSFSASDESGRPESGRVLAFAARAVTIKDDDDELHKARTFALSDLARIESLDKHVRAIATEAAAEAWGHSADSGMSSDDHDATASAPELDHNASAK